MFWLKSAFLFREKNRDRSKNGSRSKDFSSLEIMSFFQCFTLTGIGDWYQNNQLKHRNKNLSFHQKSFRTHFYILNRYICIWYLIYSNSFIGNDGSPFQGCCCQKDIPHEIGSVHCKRFIRTVKLTLTTICAKE